MGARGYDMLWRPMLEGKFSDHYQEVNLAWFWARIVKRSPRLGYYKGGFQAFVDALVNRVTAQGADIHLNARVTKVPVSYTHLRAHETLLDLVCRLLLEKKKKDK